MYPNKKAEPWKQECWKILETIEGGRFGITTEVAIHVEFYFSDNRSCDMDNRIKTLQDIMRGTVYTDDKQVRQTSYCHNTTQEKAYCIVFVARRASPSAVRLYEAMGEFTLDVMSCAI